MNLPGRHHYQDIAKAQSSSNSNTVYFSKYLADTPSDPERPIVATESANVVTENAGSILDFLPSLKNILADQEIKDEPPQKSSQNIENVEKKTQTQNKQPFDSFLFWKPLLADHANENKEDSNIFNGFSTKLQQYDLYNWLVNFLVNDEDFDQVVKDKSSKSESQKLDSNSPFSIIDSLFADPDLAGAISGVKDQEKNRIKENVIPTDTLKIKEKERNQKEQENNQEEQVKKEKLDDELHLETDELLESFKIFLRGYSAGKSKKKSSDEIRTDFKTFLETKQNLDKEDQAQKSSSKKIIIEETKFRKGTAEKNLGVSSILSKFLVDDELVVSQNQGLKQVKNAQPEDSSFEHVSNFLKGILADDGQTKDSKPRNEGMNNRNEITDLLQEFLAGNQKIETSQTAQNEEKQDKKGSTVTDLFEELLVEKDSEVNSPSKRSSSDSDSSNFFTSLLADDSSDSNSNPTTSGPKILSFFKNLMAKETSAGNKDIKTPMNDFLDFFGSVLADGNVVESEFEEISHDDPFHLCIQAFLLNGNEAPKSTFPDEIRKLSTYLKKFLYSDENNYPKKKNSDKEEGNPLESFFSSFLA